jgi:hypothetical protein
MINLFGKKERNDNALEVFAQVDVNELFFSAKVSEDFQRKVQSASQYLKVTSSVKARGGKLIPNSSTNPIDLQKEYT